MFGGYGMMGGYGNGFWGMGIIGMLIQFLIIIGVIYFIFHLIRSFNHQQYTNQSNNALDILKERYARGEISEEEFNKIKNQLIK